MKIQIRVSRGATNPALLFVSAVLLAATLTGCACDKNDTTLASLPTDHFVSNLTGQSNTGLWNKYLGMSIPKENDMYIHVDRTVPFETLRPGDIIVFTQPGKTGLICHPVVSVGTGWAKTKGFYNEGCDHWLVTPKRYAGRVKSVAATFAGPWRTLPNLNRGAVRDDWKNKAAQSRRYYAKSEGK